MGRRGLPALLRVALAAVACLVGVRAFDAFFAAAVAVADFGPAAFRGAFVAEAVLPDATFRVATFPVGDFLAAVLFAGVFLAAAFFATTFFAAAVLTVAFFAAVFFTGALRALPLPDALLFVAGVRVADFLVAAFFAARAGAADLLAAVFRVAVALRAAAPVVFFAAALRAVVFAPVFFAAELAPVPAFGALPRDVPATAFLVTDLVAFSALPAVSEVARLAPFPVPLPRVPALPEPVVPAPVEVVFRVAMGASVAGVNPGRLARRTCRTGERGPQRKLGFNSWCQNICSTRGSIATMKSTP